MNRKHVQRIERLFNGARAYNFKDEEYLELQDAIRFLCDRGILIDLEIDNSRAYHVDGSFDIVYQWLDEQEKQEKKDKRSSLRHDALVAVIGAVAGGVVTYCLFKWFGIGG